MRSRTLIVLSAICAGVLAVTPALAVPTHVLHENLQHCDPLFVPQFVHELGIAPAFTPFPDELIDAVSTFTQDPACPPADDPLIANRLVVMTNLTGIAWRDVWYVADPPNAAGGAGTTITNYDGLVDAFPGSATPGQAFQIDTLGINKPLVFESIAANGIFEVGEVWHFIIQDYVNTAAPALLPELFNSVGVASASAGGPPSSGSIIAVAIPEPNAVAAIGLVTATLGIRRRRR